MKRKPEGRKEKLLGMVLLNIAEPVKAKVQTLAADSQLSGEATILVVI